jgi:asparagine synthase (glutamine-hydrolysing)
MCGIAGYSGAFRATLLERMNAAQSHRGPDGHGVWVSEDGRTGLAHRRLAILDLTDAGLQPMRSADGRSIISFNGEIYNFRELKADLEAKGHVFRTRSDTEVLLALYRQEGPDFLQRLNGMFALALYDFDKDLLLLARDRYGVKPLYYAQTPLGLVFASELRTLLEERSVPTDIDEAAVDYHLAYVWAPTPTTMLKAARKLGVGEALEVRQGKIARRWRFVAPEQSPPDRSMRMGDAVDQLRALLQQAVRRQLVSDAPVGAFLSGGLDSSSIVSYARREGAPTPCFTIDSEEVDSGFVADLPYAQAVAEELGAELDVVRTTPDWCRELPDLAGRLDEPLADPAALNVLAIARRARDLGVKVLLSGAGGDDLFSGYRRHTALMAEPLWSWAPRGVRSVLAGAARKATGPGALMRRIRRAFQYADMNEQERIAAYFLWLSPQSIGRLTGRGGDVLAPLQAALAEVGPNVERLDRMLFLERRFFLADHNLNYTDKASMAAGVEVRVPFLDPDLVEFAATIPARLKVRGGESKWIFKRAMQGIVPGKAIWRPKAGFGAPLATWLRGPLKPWLHDVLSSETARGRFETSEVRALQDALDGGAYDAAYPLFSLACMTIWIEALKAHAGANPARAAV